MEGQKIQNKTVLPEDKTRYFVEAAKTLQKKTGEDFTGILNWQDKVASGNSAMNISDKTYESLSRQSARIKKKSAPATPVSKKVAPAPKRTML